jgi:hypothetical protein
MVKGQQNIGYRAFNQNFKQSYRHPGVSLARGDIFFVEN